MSFDPATLFANNEVGAWYEPRDISTLFQDQAGTVPVTQDGQPVGLILDKSGNGNHAFQSVSSKRPTYRDVDEVQWLEFDGIDDSMSAPSFDMSPTDKMGLFVALTPSSTSADIVCELGTDASAGGFWFISRSVGLQYFGRGGRNGNNQDFANSNDFSITDASIATSQLNINDGLPATIRRNGNQEGQSNATDFGGGNFANKNFYIGARANTLFYYEGKIFGLVLRGDQSTLTEITGTEGYLKILTVRPSTATGTISLPSLTFQGSATASQVNSDFTIRINNSVKTVQIDVANKIIETRPNRFTIRI